MLNVRVIDRIPLRLVRRCHGGERKPPAQSPLFHAEQYVGWHAMGGEEFCACTMFYVEHY